MTIALTIVLALAIFAVAGWLLLRRKPEKLTIPQHRMPKNLRLTQTPMADLETFRFKPTPTTDTVYIPRVGPGQNKHYVDLTAEMPAITQGQINGSRHA